MARKLDADARVLKGVVKALDKSTSREMLRVNLDYLWDRYIQHPIPGQVFGEPTLDTRQCECGTQYGSADLCCHTCGHCFIIGGYHVLAENLQLDSRPESVVKS